MHTPRFWGQPCRAGVSHLDVFFTRPLWTNWFNVGISILPRPWKTFLNEDFLNPVLSSVCQSCSRSHFLPEVSMSFEKLWVASSKDLFLLFNSTKNLLKLDILTKELMESNIKIKFIEKIFKNPNPNYGHESYFKFYEQTLLTSIEFFKQKIR